MSPQLKFSSFKLSRFFFSTSTLSKYVNNNLFAAFCSFTQSPSAMVSNCILLFTSFFNVMTYIQPQTRVFDLQGNETFVTRQSDMGLPFILHWFALLSISSNNCPDVMSLLPYQHQRPLPLKVESTSSPVRLLPPSKISTPLAMMNISCFARWKLPTETTSLWSQQMAISELSFVMLLLWYLLLSIMLTSIKGRYAWSLSARR